ncbi:hypothetical protein LCGC14_1646140 [marine sediment metagenome]|uniref:Uncharacterized protein n=1 Tax=marine sediment metagenome TaxID=412755 RepID=A0A0F9KE06_9ZZZZ
MAYTNAGFPTNIPAGSDNLNTADDQLRRLRLDLKERFNDIVDDITADPIVLKNITPKLAHVYENAGATISSGVNTTVAWTAETLDTGSFHDNSTNNSRLTITDAGYYHLYCVMQLSAGATTDVIAGIEIRKNGSSTVAINDQYHPGNSTDQTFQIGVIVLAAATDYYEVRVLQASGDNWTIRAPTEQSYFEIKRLAGTT